MNQYFPAIIVGAGPAGLAVSYELQRRRVEHIVLERGPRVGDSWVNTYDSLRLHTGKHLSSLPGLRFPRNTPLFPTRTHFVGYLEAYAERFRIPVHFGQAVREISPGERWRIATDQHVYQSSVLVLATGIMSNPVIPEIPDRSLYRGRILHSVEYRRADEFIGKRVLIVGVGNSAGEIGTELAHAGADVDIAVRSGANVVPLRLLGIPIQYLSMLIQKLPRATQERIVVQVRKAVARRRGPPVLPPPNKSPLDAIPLIGFHLVDAIRDGKIALRPGIERLTPAGACFRDGTTDAYDVVILATGFRPALQPLGAHVQVDARGFALRTDRVSSADHRTLFYVGHNYDATGGINNINRDAPLAAAAVARVLAEAQREAR